MSELDQVAMIRLVDVVQHYGVRPVLVDVNIEVRRGELVCLLGPNGIGKTTLLAVMAGVLAPQKGYGGDPPRSFAR